MPEAEDLNAFAHVHLLKKTFKPEVHDQELNTIKKLPNISGLELQPSYICKKVCHSSTDP